MHVHGPDFVALQVRDLAASRSFYTEQLGLEVDPAGPPHAVVFRTDPIPFAVREPTEELPTQPRPGVGVALWMRADDPDALAAKLDSAGVRIVEPVHPGGFGRQFTFADPDGYLVTVHG